MTDEVEEYLSNVPAERSKRFHELFTKIKTWFPQAEITMSYRMPTFKTKTGWAAIANQKSYISVYTCGYDHIESYIEKHSEIKCGKGCLNFRDRDEIVFKDLKPVIASALKNNKSC